MMTNILQQCMSICSFIQGTKIDVKIGHFELTEDEIEKYNKQDEISTFNETSFS